MSATEEEAKEVVKKKKKVSGTTKYMGVRIPVTLDKAMDEYIRRDTHMSKSDLVRSAIRDKLDDSGIIDEMIRKNGDKNVKSETE